MLNSIAKIFIPKIIMYKGNLIIFKMYIIKKLKHWIKLIYMRFENKLQK